MNGAYDHIRGCKAIFKAIAILARKRIRLQRDLNPWPSHHRCDAVPTEL